MNKKLKVLLFIYLFQIIASCNTCDCGDMQTYEKTYNGIELKAWDTSGFQNEEVTDTVYRNAFGLSVSVEFDLNEVTSHSKIDLSSFGFMSAYACDCVEPKHIISDPIDTIEIIVTDTETQIETIVTDNFSTHDNNGNSITTSELFENREDWQDGFQFDLEDLSNIPNSSIFTVHINLESGIQLSETTEEINFIN